MNPQKSVRIKYVHDDEIICYRTGGVVPSVDEGVLIHEEDETGVPVNKQRYIVKSVEWRVADTPERKPDVVTVLLETKQERENRIEKLYSKGKRD